MMKKTDSHVESVFVSEDKVVVFAPRPYKIH